MNSETGRFDAVAEPVSVVSAEPVNDATTTSTLRRAAVRGGASIVTGRLVVQLLTLAVTFLVARLLRPYDYGVVATSSLFLIFSDSLATAGLGVALVQREDLSREAEKEVFTVTLALSIVLFLALITASEPLALFFRIPELGLVMRVSSLLLLLLPFRTVTRSLMQRRLQLGRSAAIMTIVSILQYGIVLGAALAGLGYWSFVLGYIISQVVETVVLLQQTRWRPGLRLPGPASWEMLKFGTQYMSSGLLWQIYGQADFAVAGRLLGAHVLGVYSFAFQSVSMPANRIAASLGQVSYTIFCRMQDHPDRMRDWYLRLIRILAAMGVPLFAGVALVASDAVAVVLGSRWMSAVLPIQLLCVPGYVFYINAPFQSLLNARGRPDLPMRINLVSALILPPLFLAFGMGWGLPGICLVWMVVYPLIIGAFYTVSRPVTGFGLRDMVRYHLPSLRASGVMALTVLLVQSLLVPVESTLLRLVVAVITGAITYLGAIWALERDTVFRDLGTFLRELRG